MVLSEMLILLFLIIGLFLSIPVWLNYKTRNAAIRVISKAIDSDKPLEQELIDHLLPKKRQWQVGKWYTIIILVLGVLSFCMGLALIIGGITSRGNIGAESSTGIGVILAGTIQLSSGIGYLTLSLASFRFFSGYSMVSPKWEATSIFGLFCLFCGTAALFVGLGLFVGGSIYPDTAASTRAGIFVAALICTGSGSAFLLLGLAIFRYFSIWPEE